MKFVRFVGAGSRHFGFLIRCLFIVIVIRLSLTILSYRTIAKHIRLRDRQDRDPPSRALIVWGVRNVARLVPRADCLTQALAVQYLLAREGVSCVIRVGMSTKESGDVEAHAWVVHDDLILIGGDESRLAGFKKLIDLRPA